ncbi:hypothetical protein HZA75_02080 [Candidatus Roizmanbacteria bacterium]|nr:hypothetical protein [Candidatus Roizmanbacteria bacterium]
MKLRKLIKRIWQFAINNYFISIFLAAIAFVAVVSVYKLFFTKPTYVYTKVKVSQGLWWAATQKPSIWFVKAIKKGDAETDLVGKPVAEILSVHYYPWYGSDQFDVYLTLKLKVSKNKKTGKYNFKRSTIGVASPIDLEFPSVQFSGTITDINDRPFKDAYIEKTITLTKKNAYPWEYDVIQVGDKYFDGDQMTFEVLDKKSTDITVQSPDFYGNNSDSTLDLKKYIIVKVKIKVNIIDNQLFFGPEQKIVLGKTLNISTNNFTFNDYTISKVE